MIPRSGAEIASLRAKIIPESLQFCNFSLQNYRHSFATPTPGTNGKAAQMRIRHLRAWTVSCLRFCSRTAESWCRCHRLLTVTRSGRCAALGWIRVWFAVSGFDGLVSQAASIAPYIHFHWHESWALRAFACWAARQLKHREYDVVHLWSGIAEGIPRVSSPAQATSANHCRARIGPHRQTKRTAA